jgi:hypothetical protein
VLPSGWIVPIPIAIPNLIWALVPQRHAPVPSVPPVHRGLNLLALVESIGRVVVFALPFFLDLHVQTGLDRVLAGVAAIALVVYYAGWVRYFLHGSSPSLLFASLGPLPVPLAVAPVVYFLAFAGIARSPLMAFVAAAFGFAHISLSLRRVSAA